jgi:hypothetical protein
MILGTIKSKIPTTRSTNKKYNFIYGRLSKQNVTRKEHIEFSARAMITVIRVYATAIAQYLFFFWSRSPGDQRAR